MITNNKYNSNKRKYCKTIVAMKWGSHEIYIASRLSLGAEGVSGALLKLVNFSCQISLVLTLTTEVVSV